MMRKFASMWRDEVGTMTIEFALIGPTLIAMFMGILQFGIGMQNYNALRGISSDVARYAVVSYQTKNKLTPNQLEDYANAIAPRAPYGLVYDNFESEVTRAATQRVSGATEYTLTLNYRLISLVGFIGLEDIPLSYSRPIFVLEDA
jgi:Flp pilus assembly protein TadG